MTNKVALIIGAGDSLGSSIARVFANDGFTVVVARRNGDKLSELAAEIKKNGGECFFYSLDARKEDDVISLINKIENEIGEILVAVYNIGANIRYGILETTSRSIIKFGKWLHSVHFLWEEKLQKKWFLEKKGL